MKNTIIMVLLLTTSLFVSCRKEAEKEDQAIHLFFPGDQKTGHFKTERNGESIEGTAFAAFLNSFNKRDFVDISFRTFSEFGERREDLSFHEIPLKIGQFPIKGLYSDMNDGFIGSLYGIWGSDGDVVACAYDPNDETAGILELTKVDTIANEIEGTITRAGFKLSWGSSTEEFPEKVVFRNATFSMKIIN